MKTKNLVTDSVGGISQCVNKYWHIFVSIKIYSQRQATVPAAAVNDRGVGAMLSGCAQVGRGIQLAAFAR
jgi:hypothetical protein